MAKYNIFDGSNWCDACAGNIKIQDANGNWQTVGAGARIYANGAWHTISCDVEAWAAPLISETGPYNTIMMWQIVLSSPLSVDTTIPIQIKRTDTGQTNTYYPRVPAGITAYTVIQSDGSTLRTTYAHSTTGASYKVEAILYGAPAYITSHDKKYCRYTIPVSGQYSSGTPVYSLT